MASTWDITGRPLPPDQGMMTFVLPAGTPTEYNVTIRLLMHSTQQPLDEHNFSFITHYLGTRVSDIQNGYALERPIPKIKLSGNLNFIPLA